MSLPFDKTLQRIYLSTWDFEQAQDFIDAAAKHDEASIEYKALLLTAIVCYARPFSGNEIGKNAPADPKLTGIDVQAVLGADFALHERIVHLRNCDVAHSSVEFNPSEQLASAQAAPGRPVADLKRLLADQFRGPWRSPNLILSSGGTL